MRVAIYSRHWRVAGGGEQVAGEMARALADKHDVTILGWGSDRRSDLRTRVGLDLEAVQWQEITDDRSVFAASKHFDLFVNACFGSLAPQQAKSGMYYVHFPEPEDLNTVPVESAARKLLVRPLRRVPRPILPERVRLLVDDTIPRFMPGTDALGSYARLLANSRFTAEWTSKRWNRIAEVLYPPVRLVPHSTVEKEKRIVVLGRFIDPALGHCKRQLEAVQSFRALVERGLSSGWRLQLIGGVGRDGESYLKSVQRAAEGLPIDVLPNASEEERVNLLQRAAFVWQLTGIGLDVNRDPFKFEHFGISLVEAMSAGAIPVVLGVAGPAEIVRDSVDGFHVKNLSELVEKTLFLVNLNAMETARLRVRSVERSGAFRGDCFADAFTRIVDEQLG